ncbi:ketopantoate reductase family protein [Thermodesulfobacteriota bacterium]
MKKIAIIGAGAMGSLFGALLAESGTEVLLCDIWSDHVTAINQDGLQVEQEGKTRTVRIHATTDPDEIGHADLVMIFVKSTQTAQAAETAAGIAGPNGLLMTLQNGMGNADLISQCVDPSQVIAGTTSHGATVIGPGMIRHAGKGPTTIGSWLKADSIPESVSEIADIFNRAGIEAKTVIDVRPVIWEKLLVNIGINAITALTGIKNGQIVNLDATRNLSRNAVEEARTVAAAQGVKTRSDAVSHVFQIAEATSANRSSMGQDVDHKRQTEIGAINGFIVNEANRLGLKAPVNKTLTALIETLQAHY